MHRQALVKAYSPSDGDHLLHYVSAEGDDHKQFLYDKETDQNRLWSVIPETPLTRTHTHAVLIKDQVSLTHEQQSTSGQPPRLTVFRRFKGRKTFRWATASSACQTQTEAAELLWAHIRPVLHAPNHWPGLCRSLTCPLSWWKLPGCSKQTRVLTSRNVVWGNNIKVAFNVTLERLNPAELLAGPSLQTCVVQRRIVQTHRTLF